MVEFELPLFREPILADGRDWTLLTGDNVRFIGSCWLHFKATEDDEVDMWKCNICNKTYSLNDNPRPTNEMLLDHCKSHETK
jgi:hypothetical protein